VLGAPLALDASSDLRSTIGAGDTFIAGILYSWLVHRDDWPLTEKLAFANELAGRKVVQEGYSGLAELMQRRNLPMSA